jgi:segregation and condensation protein B
MTLKNIIEALLFASQKPLMPHEIVAALRTAADDEDAEAKEFSRVKEAEIAALLQQLKLEYISAEHAFQLVEQVNGWHVVTAPEYGKWVRQLYPESKPSRLSGPALETLAIVAYRQPITKADIEAVRGVAVDGMMQALLEKGLVRIAGRAEVPGRPLLYETTEYFLEHFGLRAVDELPNSAELRRVNLPTAPVQTEPPKPEAAPELPLAEQGAEPLPEPQPESETSDRQLPKS